jgi:transcriptional regulator with XRE-family HTH domain
MKTREQLIQTESYWMVKIQNDLYGKVEEYMLKNKINRTQMAGRLGVTKGYLSQVLNGDFNHKLSKLVEISLAIGVAPLIEFKDLREYIEEDKNYIKNITISQPAENLGVIVIHADRSEHKMQSTNKIFDSQSTIDLPIYESPFQEEEDLMISY